MHQKPPLQISIPLIFLLGRFYNVKCVLTHYLSCAHMHAFRSNSEQSRMHTRTHYVELQNFMHLQSSSPCCSIAWRTITVQSSLSNRNSHSDEQGETNTLYTCVTRIPRRDPQELLSGCIKQHEVVKIFSVKANKLFRRNCGVCPAHRTWKTSAYMCKTYKMPMLLYKIKCQAVSLPLFLR